MAISVVKANGNSTETIKIKRLMDTPFRFQDGSGIETDNKVYAVGESIDREGDSGAVRQSVKGERAMDMGFLPYIPGKTGIEVIEAQFCQRGAPAAY